MAYISLEVDLAIQLEENIGESEPKDPLKGLAPDSGWHISSYCFSALAGASFQGINLMSMKSCHWELD